MKYSILIQWSDEDKKYVVSLPEWGKYAHTHGNTYEEALKNAKEVLQLLIIDTEARGAILPQIQTFS